MRLTLFIIQLFIFIPLFSQNSVSNKIDSILDESFQKFSQLKLIESSELANHALQLSTMENYSQGKVTSNIYIAKVLIEVGLNMDALKYIQNVYDQPFFNNNIIYQVESHRLKGKIYGSEQLYTLAKEEFEKQLYLSERIADSKKREMSKLWAYQNIEHLYSTQGITDSVKVYLDLQERQLSNFEEHEATYNLSTLYTNKARLNINKNRLDEAAAQLQKSIDLLNKYNFPYKYNTLRTFGILEVKRGNIDKAVAYYDEALGNSSLLDVTNVSRDLHKDLANYLFENDTLIDKAKKHQKEYGLLNDSLENHNKLLAEAILKTIINEKEVYVSQNKMLYKYIIIGLLVTSFSIGFILIVKNRNKRRSLIRKELQFVENKEKIEDLKDQIENNLFNDIIELAKSNSPEFLPLFAKNYPEFVDAMKQLDPTIRNTELYFLALSYLNFSTKEIASYTFVTNRAVQVRRNRMRKKYNISSDVDFNEWLRSLENGKTLVDEEVIG